MPQPQTNPPYCYLFVEQTQDLLAILSEQNISIFWKESKFPSLSETNLTTHNIWTKPFYFLKGISSNNKGISFP